MNNENNVENHVDNHVDNHRNTAAGENLLQEKGGLTGKKYLTFMLDDEKYAIPLGTVKEIIGMEPITPIPHVPPFFKGLINLKGIITSTIDLKLKLKIRTKNEKVERSSLIITEVNGSVIGIIVDDVTEVIVFPDQQIETNVSLSGKVSADYIQGVARIGEKHLVIILEIQKVVNLAELNLSKKKQEQ